MKITDIPYALTPDFMEALEDAHHELTITNQHPEINTAIKFLMEVINTYAKETT